MVADYQYMNHIVNAQTKGQAEQRSQAGSSPIPTTTQNNTVSVSSGASTMRKAIIAIVVVLIAVVIVYAIANLAGIRALHTTTSIYYPGNTTLNPSTSNLNGASCGDFVVSQSNFNTLTNGTCYWNGGPLSVYYGSGNSGSINLSVTNTRTGISLVALYSNKTCSTYTGTYNLTAGQYLIEFVDGKGNGTCGNAFVGLSNITAQTT